MCKPTWLNEDVQNLLNLSEARLLTATEFSQKLDLLLDVPPLFKELCKDIAKSNSYLTFKEFKND
jgi:hypothetical protein